MNKRETDPLNARLEDALDLGNFISYGQSWDYVRGLEDIKGEIDRLASQEPERTVALYELFLAGCYEKAEEIDDSSGGLGTFFEILFCSWVQARQNAGRDPGETVEQILAWMEKDDYGFCHQIERDLAPALGRKEYTLFKTHFECLLAKALEEHPADAWEVRGPVGILKTCYALKKELQPYLALCERLGTTPEDCEAIARIYRAKGKPEEALEWVEKGLNLGEKSPRSSSDSAAYELDKLRKELLSKLGREDEAFQLAWASFIKSPNEYSYQDFMKLVPASEKAAWHQKAMEAAGKADLRSFIGICTHAKEWDAIAERIEKAEHKSLESLSHYTSEPVAKKLEKQHPLIAAKVYRALGMRIVNSNKSKYYSAAIGHLRKARDLYIEHGKQELWSSIVTTVHQEHSRKYGFISDFDALAAGDTADDPDSFEERLRKKWPTRTNK